MLDPNWQIPSWQRTDFFQKRSRFAVIVPVLNEGERIRTQLKRMSTISRTLDVFIVDGGSTDDSLRAEVMTSSGIRSLLVKTGLGKLSAQLRLGLAHVLSDGYDGVITIDGNNKDNPEDIPLFAQALDDGYDHIQGSRFIRGGREENTPLSRMIGIKLIHAPLISLAAGFHYTDTTNGFRAYSREFLQDPRVMPFRNIFDRYELHYYLAIRAARLGFKVTEVPVERVYPKGKIPTKISPIKGNFLVLKTLTQACLGKFDPPTRENNS